MRYTLERFRAEYPDDNACLDKIMALRYGGTAFLCPSCKRSSKFHRIAKRRAYSCQHCAHHLYPCVGTPFEKSHAKLQHWFFALYVMTNTPHRVSAKEIERQTGVTYKCALRMRRELRKLISQADGYNSPSGMFEVDEPRYDDKNKIEFGNTNKSFAAAMLARDGILQAEPITPRKIRTV